MAKTKGVATSGRMVKAMLDGIHSRGYAATGINRVLLEASAPKGSMYFHFPGGKEELAERAIGLAARQFRDLIVESLSVDDDLEDVVSVILGRIAEILVAANYELGCPVSVVTLEEGGHSERLRVACLEAYESWICPISDSLVARGWAQGAARDTAMTMVSAVEGAMIISRARRDITPLQSVGRVLAELIHPATDEAAVTQ